MRAFALVVLSIAALLLLCGCAQKPEPNVQEPPVQVVLPTANNSTVAPEALCSSGNVVQKDECFLSLAKSKSDPQACRNIYSVEKLDSCYALFAGSDLEMCKKITDTALKEGCLAQNAKLQKSEAICNLIVDAGKRTECLAQILPRCMLLNIEDRALCSALEKNDSSLCDSYSCLVQYAKNTSDESACMRIDDEKEKYYCVALLEKSAQACERASIYPIRDWCVQKASIELGDMSGCSIATEGSGYRNSCYLYFAVNRRDSSICRSAAPEEMRDDCFTNYSVQTATVDACPKVVVSLNKIGCYYSAARSNRMPSLCNPLQNEAQRRDCYSMSIFSDAGPVASDCAGVDSPDWKDKCFGTAAAKSYNKTLCGFMRAGFDKDQCDSLFAS